jgi:hypothetical protein
LLFSSLFLVSFFFFPLNPTSPPFSSLRLKVSRFGRSARKDAALTEYISSDATSLFKKKSLMA